MARHSTALAREIRSIRRSFNRLAKSFGRIAPLLAAVPEQAARALVAAGKRPRRRPRLSAEQRRALKLQGKYMGTMRGLKPTERAVVKKVRASKGIRAAIAEAQRMMR